VRITTPYSAIKSDPAIAIAVEHPDMMAADFDPQHGIWSRTRSRRRGDRVRNNEGVSIEVEGGENRYISISSANASATNFSTTPSDCQSQTSPSKRLGADNKRRMGETRSRKRSSGINDDGVAREGEGGEHSLFAPAANISALSSYNQTNRNEELDSDNENPFYVEDEAASVDVLYKPEKVIKKVRGLYLTRWSGYGPEDDTLEPVENIAATGLVDVFEMGFALRKSKPTDNLIVTLKHEASSGHDLGEFNVDLKKIRFREKGSMGHDPSAKEHENDFDLIGLEESIEIWLPHAGMFIQCKIVDLCTKDKAQGA